MIPRTAARKAEMTWVSNSRQSLPRPARLYSTPSKRANAPALATAAAPVDQYPPFMPQKKSQTVAQVDMEAFLQRRPAYTILPTPLPDHEPNKFNNLYFTDSPTQDLLSVMDACLHNLYDVPRAKAVFDNMRTTDKGEALLSERVYNAFLDAYLTLASLEKTVEPDVYLTEFWQLYGEMERSNYLKPSEHTYALALLAWMRHNPESAKPLHVEGARGPMQILQSILDREISVAIVVSNKAFTTTEESVQAIKVLSKAAVEAGLSTVVNELGTAEMLGRTEVDPLENVPEAIPVTRPKRVDIEVTQRQDGSIASMTSKGKPEEQESEVPYNIQTLRRHLSQLVLARRVLPEDVASRQKLLEDSVYDVAVDRLRHQAEVLDGLGLGSKGLKSKDIRAWMWEWHQKLQLRLEAEIANMVAEERHIQADVKIGDPKRLVGLSPFLSLLSPEKLSLIVILELMRLEGTGGVVDGMKTARALLAVGKAVELEYKAEMCKKNNISIPTTTPGRPAHGSFFTNLGLRDLHARRVTAAKFVEDSEDWTTEWTQTVRVKVGSFLVDCLVDIATILRTGKDPRTGEDVSEEQPAFFHTYEYIRGFKLGVIKLNPQIAEKMANESLRETLHPRHLPMLVEPKPWLSYDQGGYIYNKTWAMRFKDSQEQASYLREASQLGNLELIYASLDVLGSTPWKINRKVFDVVLEVWNSGKRGNKIPPAVYDGPEPERPENIDTDQAQRLIYLTRQKHYNLEKAHNHSDRCSVNYKIEIARAFLGDTIYFPHNVDFRGRAYPIPPHLSHIGDDLSRGLLMFAEAKPLGESGLKWLKIHLANLYGYDKASLDDRVKFAEEHFDDISDSAENPLTGQKWWTHADDPWQCLATCKELKAALDSPDPLAYECALPVHQDGTCNGLQHYAALGGDAQGAKQVNLDVTDKPSDVYTYVANMVEQAMLKDIENGNKYAKMLSGKVARKVVKQTVMTTVYGVTFIGARDQLEKQLKDRGDIPSEECWNAATYLAKQVLSCIGDLFKGAKNIQNWLNTSGRLIAKSIPRDRLGELEKPIVNRINSKNKKKDTPANRLKREQMTSVVWTTPLGLPIVQPYRATKRKQIITAMQTVYISDPSIPTHVSSMKQASAFPPNFIHSLDATHMMLTALECRSRGLTFASVHDSYWTHANNIDEMSTIIRDTFIALHSSDILSKLRDEFMERYKDHLIPASIFRNKKRTPVAEEHGADTEDLEAATKDGEVEPVVQKRRASRKKAPAEDTESADSSLADKFVDLTSMLPPLPEKGEFDVNTIKESLYFFS